VVKIGGEPIEDPAILGPLLTDLVFLEQVGLRPVLVHGGGPAITRAMDEAGIEVRWHEGRRVTDEAAIAVVQREAEKLNAHLVNRIFDLGGAAIGLVPSRQAVVHGAVRKPELGLVGSPTTIDVERVLRYASRGLIPVLSLGDGEVTAALEPETELMPDTWHLAAATLDAARFWLDRGVSGFRCDVIGLLYESADECDFTPETRAYVRQLRGVLDEYDDRVMVAESTNFSSASYSGVSRRLIIL